MWKRNKIKQKPPGSGSSRNKNEFPLMDTMDINSIAISPEDLALLGPGFSLEEHDALFKGMQETSETPEDVDLGALLANAHSLVESINSSLGEGDDIPFPDDANSHDHTIAEVPNIPKTHDHVHSLNAHPPSPKSIPELKLAIDTLKQEAILAKRSGDKHTAIAKMKQINELKVQLKSINDQNPIPSTTPPKPTQPIDNTVKLPENLNSLLSAGDSPPDLDPLEDIDDISDEELASQIAEALKPKKPANPTKSVPPSTPQELQPPTSSVEQSYIQSIQSQINTLKQEAIIAKRSGDKHTAIAKMKQINELKKLVKSGVVIPTGPIKPKTIDSSIHPSEHIPMKPDTAHFLPPNTEQVISLSADTVTATMNTTPHTSITMTPPAQSRNTEVTPKTSVAKQNDGQDIPSTISPKNVQSEGKHQSKLDSKPSTDSNLRKSVDSSDEIIQDLDEQISSLKLRARHALAAKDKNTARSLINQAKALSDQKKAIMIDSQNGKPLQPIQNSIHPFVPNDYKVPFDTLKQQISHFKTLHKKSIGEDNIAFWTNMVKKATGEMNALKSLFSAKAPFPGLTTHTIPNCPVTILNENIPEDEIRIQLLSLEVDDTQKQKRNQNLYNSDLYSLIKYTHLTLEYEISLSSSKPPTTQSYSFNIDPENKAAQYFFELSSSTLENDAQKTNETNIVQQTNIQNPLTFCYPLARKSRLVTKTLLRRKVKFTLFGEKKSFFSTRKEQIGQCFQSLANLDDSSEISGPFIFYAPGSRTTKIHVVLTGSILVRYPLTSPPKTIKTSQIFYTLTKNTVKPTPQQPPTVQSSSTSTSVADMQNSQSIEKVAKIVLLDSEPENLLSNDVLDFEISRITGNTLDDTIKKSALQTRQLMLVSGVQNGNVSPQEYCENLESLVEIQKKFALQYKSHGQTQQAIVCMKRVNLMRNEIAQLKEMISE